MRIKKCFCLIVLLFGFCTFSEAVKPVRRSGVLKIDHKAGVFQNISYKGDQLSVQRLNTESTTQFRIYNNEDILIEIVNPNPLLYKYEWKGIVKTKTANFQIAEQIVKDLQPLQKKLKENQIEQLDTAYKRLQSSVPQVARLNAFSYSSDITEFPKLMEIIKSISAQKSVDSKDSESLKIATVFCQLFHEVENIPKYLEKTEGDNDELRELRKNLDSWKSLVDSINDIYKKYDNSEIELIKTNMGLSNNDNWNDLLYMLIAQDQRSLVEKCRDSLIAFYEGLEKVGDTIELDTISYSDRENLLVTIEILPIEENKLLLSSHKASRKTGKVCFGFEPYSFFYLDYGISLVYSFVKSPAANGVEKELGIIPAMMLAFTPSFADDPTISFAVQIGVSSSDKIGFLVGGRIRLYNILYLGGGMSWHKIDTSYKAGPYISLTFELGKKNI